LALIIEAYDQDKAKLQRVNPRGLVPQLVLYTPFLIVKIVSISNLEGWPAQRCYPASCVVICQVCGSLLLKVVVALRFDSSFSMFLCKRISVLVGVVGFGNYKL